MRLTGLHLHNWLCYQGEHHLALDEKVYAVVARAHDNPERSNWLGKSSLLRAVRFGLYGTHGAPTEDQWVHTGEKDGAVRLECSDGVVVERTRRVGKSTQLLLHLPGGTTAKGDEAQHLLDERVGLCEPDFMATCYFEQKHMSRFMVARPADRMTIVSAWLRLEPLQRCADNVRAQLQQADAVVRQWQDRAAQHRHDAEQLVRQYLGGDVVDPLQGFDQAVALHVQQAEQLRGLMGRLENERDRLAKWRRDAEDSAERQRLIDEGVQRKANAPPGDEATLQRERDDAMALWNEAVAARRVADNQAAQKRSLSRGEFDGRCPVGDVQCPAVDQLNAARRRNLQLFQVAEQSAEDARRSAEEAEVQYRASEQRLAAYVRHGAELDALRRRVLHLTPAHKRIQQDGPPPGDDTLAEQVQQAAADLGANEEAARRLTAARNRYSTLMAEAQKADAMADQARGALPVLQEAVSIFGRNGAQRRVAEGALSTIEAGANAMLEECGIDLRLAVEWARTGDGLAEACDRCGNPFPPSLKVRQCSRCGAERGPKLVNRLALRLTNTSGAAEDLAGAAFQLAAAAWLRNDRGSAWAVAALDEPFGALDAANRRAFGAHLTTMLRGRYGFEQAFVIAHHDSVLDALPGRLQVTARNGRSAVEVVA